jgi:hypothetical protein
MVHAHQPSTPLFIMGASRSGTALLRSALNRHPDVFVAGETHYFDDLRVRLGGGDIELSDQDRRACEDYFLSLGHRPYGHGGDPRRSRLDRVELRDLALRLGDAPDAYFEAYCVLAQQLEREHSSGRPTIWGEKTPRHIFRLADILDRYPQARAICMYRDPRAVVASYRDWRNQGGFDLDEDQEHRAALSAEERRTRGSYDPTIATLLWKGTVVAGRAAAERYGEGRVRLQRYEDLVMAPDESLRGICAWLGLDYDARMLDVPLHNSSVTRFSPDAGISTAPLNRWRASLSAAEVAEVQLWSRRELRVLGYDEEPVRLTAPATLRLLVRVPRSLGRAAWANRRRMGHVTAYVWRRVRPLLASAP